MATNEMEMPDLKEILVKEDATSVADVVDGLDIIELESLANYALKVRAHKVQEKRQAVIEEFRRVAQSMGLSAAEALGAVGGNVKGGKLPPKYIGPNGEEYTGRGPTPRWLVELEVKGHNREEYAVENAA